MLYRALNVFTHYAVHFTTIHTWLQKLKIKRKFFTAWCT